MNKLALKSNCIEALRNSKLKPYRVIHLIDETIYEFWRVNSKNESDIHDRATLKEMAMICVNKHGIVVHYCPIDKNLQTTETLGFDKAQQIIDDLIAAGF